jgi:hypothetical protein
MKILFSSLCLLALSLLAAPRPAPAQVTTDAVRKHAEKAFKSLDAEGKAPEEAPAEAPAPEPAPQAAPVKAPLPPSPKPKPEAKAEVKPAPVADDSVDCGEGNIALNRPAQMSSVGYGGTPEAGVDGIKNGNYGVHSGGSDTGWWQVDLGKKCRLGRIAVYNRQGYENRSISISIQTTSDEKPTEATKWKKLVSYADAAPLGRDGAGGPVPFGGVYNDKPWVYEARNESARWVRLQLDAANYMNLDEIEVFGRAAAKP